MNISRETRMRQTGRTTRMLCAAVATATIRQIIIVAADVAHADTLKRLFDEKAERLSYPKPGYAR